MTRRDGQTHGENCHLWGDRHYDCALDRVVELETALEAAKEKLERYYEACGAEYLGGPHYGDLMRQIRAALSRTEKAG